MPIRLIGVIRGGMLKVDDYLKIRVLHRDGVSVREIARQLGHGRDTVKKALVEASPRGYTRETVRGGRKWGVGSEELRERNELVFVLLQYTAFSNVMTLPDVFLIPAKDVAALRRPWFESQAVYFSNPERRARLEAFRKAWHVFDL